MKDSKIQLPLVHSNQVIYYESVCKWKSLFGNIYHFSKARFAECFQFRSKDVLEQLLVKHCVCYISDLRYCTYFCALPSAMCSIAI